MDPYTVETQTYWVRRLGESNVAVSQAGDHIFLNAAQVSSLQRGRIGEFSLPLQAALKAGHFVANRTCSGSRRLLASRVEARRETVRVGPSLHIIVPTLQCAHSCQYCQVSRSLSDAGHTMTTEDLRTACDSVFESDAPTLTVEFQGGDPLLRFDLVREAIEHIQARNRDEGRPLRFVIASTLHQLDEAMCEFLADHKVLLSTSVDGPAALHNRNRPTPGRNSYERTVAGIDLARSALGDGAVSALMTTTKASLAYPEAIVDEYVKLGLSEIFIRPLSSYGFAKRNQQILGYSPEQFYAFYVRALERVMHWNRQGVQLREVYASIILNKILSPFDAGYVDLQSPTGAGQSVLVYNYDGYVYPSDEARMLAETGDLSLRLGRIGTSIKEVASSDVQRRLIASSLVEEREGCRECAYQVFCAPNPVDAQAQYGSMEAPVFETEHCQRHQWLFDYFFSAIKQANDVQLDLFHAWARPALISRTSECVA